MDEGQPMCNYTPICFSSTQTM